MSSWKGIDAKRKRGGKTRRSVDRFQRRSILSPVIFSGAHMFQSPMCNKRRSLVSSLSFRFCAFASLVAVIIVYDYFNICRKQNSSRKGKLDPSCARLLSNMMISVLLLAANDLSCNKKLNVCKQMTPASDSFAY